jgi:hypothetical protein
MAAAFANQEPDAAKAVWVDFVEKALANGTLKAKPDSIVYGKGLESIQGAMERHKQGVSAAKVVVTL